MNSKEAIEKIRRILFGSHSFNLLKTVEGAELKVDGDIELEKEIYIITPDGELPVMDGEYEIEDGMKLSVKEGKVSKIDYSTEESVEEVSLEDEVEVKEVEKTTEEVKMVTAELIDGTIVENDEEELKVGDTLYVKTEEGRVLAPSADHVTTEGKTIVVVDGVITEIRDEEKVETETEVEVTAEELSFDEILETFTAGFNHLNQQLNELKENYDTLQANFSKFSAEPAGERVFNHKDYVETKTKERFSKLETLAALKNKKK